MNWISKGRFYRETEDGVYAVCRMADIHASAGFEAWYRPGRAIKRIGFELESLEAAMRECEEHAGIVAGTHKPESS